MGFSQAKVHVIQHIWSLLLICLFWRKRKLCSVALLQFCAEHTSAVCLFRSLVQSFAQDIVCGIQ